MPSEDWLSGDLDDASTLDELSERFLWELEHDRFLCWEAIVREGQDLTLSEAHDEALGELSVFSEMPERVLYVAAELAGLGLTLERLRRAVAFPPQDQPRFERLLSDALDLSGPAAPPPGGACRGRGVVVAKKKSKRARLKAQRRRRRRKQRQRRAPWEALTDEGWGRALRAEFDKPASLGRYISGWLDEHAAALDLDWARAALQLVYAQGEEDEALTLYDRHLADAPSCALIEYEIGHFAWEVEGDLLRGKRHLLAAEALVQLSPRGGSGWLLQHLKALAGQS